jgi:hypothetical protein
MLLHGEGDLEQAGRRGEPYADRNVEDLEGGAGAEDRVADRPPGGEEEDPDDAPDERPIMIAGLGPIARRDPDPPVRIQHLLCHLPAVASTSHRGPRKSR